MLLLLPSPPWIGIVGTVYMHIRTDAYGKSSIFLSGYSSSHIGLVPVFAQDKALS